MSNCSCCEGLSIETPAAITNRPGLNAIAYRIGTHSRFKESLLARLTTLGLPALRDLRTRDDDDPSIALLDAWATVADVLTFYQERIANEAYLRTATERLSLRELARLIGYNVRPGVAASVYLAFTLDTAPGSPTQTTIETGTKVQSIPGPNETAQTFETMEKITARVGWNAMRPRLTTPQTVTTTMAAVRVKGTNTNLSKGDALLLVVPSSGDTVEQLRFVSSAVTDDKKDETTIALQPIPPVSSFTTAAPFGTGIFAANKIVLNDTTVSSVVVNKTWNQNDLNSFALQQGFGIDALFANIKAQLAAKLPPPDVGVFALRKRASLFGNNAPDWNAMADSTRARYAGTADPKTFSDWPLQAIGQANQIALDAVYKEIKRDDWVAVTRPNATVIARVQAVAEIALATYAISGKVTQLTLDTDDAKPASMSSLRQTTVFVQSEPLTLVELPDTTAVQGTVIPLNEPVAGLTPGQTVVVTGARSDLAGVQASETAVLASVALTGGYTVLTLAGALENSYVRDTVAINANVALATHGETTREILGSGDARVAYQQFALKSSPLTYVSAQNETGAATTLDVFVNDVRWREAPFLYGKGPRDRIFITRSDEAGKTFVQFGDGSTGARTPTGQGNVRATYRKGIGKAGNLKAGQLSLLLTRPLGVKDVTNPVAAAGGDDAETLVSARLNAPLTMLTLGRIVSLQDYEDFARSFAGVAKALATWTWNGQARGIFVTITGPDGATIAEDSTTYKNLLGAMKNAGDPYVPLRVVSYQPTPFTLQADLKIDPDYQASIVRPQVEQKLRDAFSFSARAFGQPVMASQVLQVMHSVAGVLAVDLNALYRIGEAAVPNARLAAAFPRAGAGGILEPAELLTLDPRPLNLRTMN